MRSTHSSRVVPSLIAPICAAATFTYRDMVISSKSSADGAGERRHRRAAAQVVAEARALLQLAVLEQCLGAGHRHPGTSPAFPSFVERPPRDAVEIGDLDAPLVVGIPDEQVGVAADADRALARV